MKQTIFSDSFSDYFLQALKGLNNSGLKVPAHDSLSAVVKWRFAPSSADGPTYRWSGMRAK